MLDQSTSLTELIRIIRQKLNMHAVRIPMRGHSMMLTIKDGQKVIIICKPFNEIILGDIALFVADKQLILHRIIYKENIDNVLMFLTRGDNCESLDNWIVNEKDILGVALLM